MKTTDVNFIKNLSFNGRQQKAVIILEDGTEIDENNINSISLSYNGSLLKSVMKELDLDVNNYIEKGTKIEIRFGFKVSDNNYNMVSLGYFIVYEIEKVENQESYSIKCYDEMLYSMQMYERLRDIYPCTLRNFVEDLCNKLGYRFSTNNFMNENIMLQGDVFDGIGFTYRDVLDDIAEATGTTIYIKYGELILGTPTQTDFTITEENLKDGESGSVSVGKKYGVINSIVLSRAGGSDNIYYKDDESIEKNGLCEFKITDNQLMNDNDRDRFLPGIAYNLFGLSFFVNDLTTYGIVTLDLLDMYYLQIGENTYNCLMLSSDLIIDQDLEEYIYTNQPEETTTDYTKADKTDRRINQTYLIVDKQNQTIEGVVSNVTEQNNKISRILQTVDELNSKISDIADITISKETNVGVLEFEKINESEPIHIEIRPLGQSISYLYPSLGLFPSEDLYLKTRYIKFTNLDTDDVIIYELPDDLLYLDSETYDEFILDYDSQSVYINKRCDYDEYGNVYKLDKEVINEFEFPNIYLTNGDYRVEVENYICYLQARLMVQNIYTTQFATKAEVRSEISQTATNIDLSVNKKLESYSTTTEMQSAINITAQDITSTVSQTYATKNQLNTTKSEIKQTTDSISATVSNNNTKANIVAKINDGTSQVQINADSISLAGKQINMTADNVSLASSNFNVDKWGNMRCSNANVSGYINATNGIFNGDIRMSSSKTLTSYHANGAIASRIDQYGLKVYQDDGSYAGQFTAYWGAIDGVYTSGISMILPSGSDITLTNRGVYSNQSFYARGFYNTSRAELKENINKLNINAIEEIKNTDVYKFNYKDDVNKDEVIGFVIGKNYNTTNLIHNDNAINLYSSVGILWKAVQEQQEIIENLQKEINNLKGEK